MNTIRTMIRAAACLGTFAALGGCMTSTPQWDANFGNSVTQLRAMQTANPDASLNQDPVAGIDGPAADSAMQNYGKSFDAPTPPTNVFTIGVGAGSTN